MEKTNNYVWHKFDSKNETDYVTDQLIVDLQIKAQIWYHENTKTFSMTSYEDEELGITNGNEHYGAREELKLKANQLFGVNQ